MNRIFLSQIKKNKIYLIILSINDALNKFKITTIEISRISFNNHLFSI